MTVLNIHDLRDRKLRQAKQRLTLDFLELAERQDNGVVAVTAALNFVGAIYGSIARLNPDDAPEFRNVLEAALKEVLGDYGSGGGAQ